MRTALRPLVTGGIVTLLVLTLGSCGTSDADGGQDSTAVAAAVPPPLADVEPLADVRDWDGVRSVIAADELDPVATDPAPALPVTVTDAQGTRVTVRDTGRVLALDLYGTLARTVAELGLADRLVGRDRSTQFPGSEDLPLVTPSGHDLTAEAILALDPTLIITDTSLGPWDVVLQMRDAGIPVVVVDSHRGLDNVTDLIEAVAGALGVPDEGAALAERTQGEIDDVVARIAGVAPSDASQRLRTVFLYVRGQSGVYYMFGGDSGADTLIDAVGAYDVADEIGWDGMKPLTDEGLVAAQPDLVLMMTAGLESAGGVDGLLERLPALAQTPAGQRQRFVTMQDAEILGFGPATADVLEALAVAIYAPDAIS